MRCSVIGSELNKTAVLVTFLLCFPGILGVFISACALDYRFGKLQANDDNEIAVIRTFVRKGGGSVNVKSYYFVDITLKQDKPYSP